MLLKQLNEKLHKAQYRDGCDCVFIQLGKKKQVGAKMYTTKEKRDFAYNQQLLASKNNIGPRVYFKFEYFAEKFERSYYCYLTECCDVLKTDKIQYYQLLEKGENIGLHYFTLVDTNIDHNTGQIKGKPVFFDFAIPFMDTVWAHDEYKEEFERKYTRAKNAALNF